MTIAAGFTFADGVLICADTEMSDSVSKFQHSKVMLYDIGPAKPGDKVAFAIVGDVAYARRAVGLCSAALIATALKSPTDMTNEGMQSTLEKTLKQFHEKYIFTHPMYTHAQAPTVELMIGVWSHVTGRTSLFSTQECVVNDIHTFDCLGAGSYFARSMAQLLWGHNLTFDQIYLLAAHILQQTKNNVPNCGKKSDLVILKNGSGTMDVLPAMRTSFVEQYSDSYVRLMGTLLFNLADSSNTFEHAMEQFTPYAHGLYRQYQSQQANFDAIAKAIAGRQKEFADAAKRFHRKNPEDVTPLASTEQRGGKGRRKSKPKG